MATPTIWTAAAAPAMAAMRASTSATTLSVSIHSVVRGHHVYNKFGLRMLDPRSSAVYPENVDCCRLLLDALTDCCRRFAVVVMAQPATTIVGRVYPESVDCCYWTRAYVRVQQNIPYHVFISTGEYHNCIFMNINEQDALIRISEGSD